MAWRNCQAIWPCACRCSILVNNIVPWAIQFARRLTTFWGAAVSFLARKSMRSRRRCAHIIIRPTRLVLNFHFLREPRKLERWATLGCLAFILQKILELLAMQAWSFARMTSWRKSYGLSENTAWSRATFTISSEEIFAWTKSRLQYSR